ncbi:MAG: hypothetical protein FWB98_02380 [Defluviitaleaceae bacterium]|nr:hypothetical protein [Defluviitaleaceae bacterium]
MTKKNYPNPKDVPPQTVLSTELTGSNFPTLDYDPDFDGEPNMSDQLRLRKPDLVL